MTRFLAALAAVVLVLTAVTLHAKELKQVYLRDGSIVEAESVRRSGDTVTVTVSRDVVLDFPADQVDLKKTFPAKPHKPVKKHRRHRAYPKVSRPEKKQTSPATVPGKPGPTAPAPGAAAAPGKPVGAVPAAVPGKPGAAPAITQTKPGTSPPAAAKPAPGKPAPPVQGKATSAKAGAAKPAAPNAAPKPGAPQPAAVPAPKPASPAAPPLTLKPPVAPAPAPPAGFLAVVAATMGMTFIVVEIAIIVLLIASFWKIFEKAGKPGWAAVIPIYNVFVLVQISGRPWWWFLLLLIPLVGLIIALLLFMDLAKRFDKHPLFGVGLFFLGFIFFPILAFDSSTYR